MVNIEKIDHVGIRVTKKEDAIAFYKKLGFELIFDSGFEQDHPVIMQHPSTVVINLLGPATPHKSGNVLMDIPEKYPGYTHMSLKVSSLEEVRSYMEKEGIAITGSFSFKGLSAIFIRDVDGNVIEFDEYEGEEPDSRTDRDADADGFEAHP